MKRPPVTVPSYLFPASLSPSRACSIYGFEPLQILPLPRGRTGTVVARLRQRKTADSTEKTWGRLEQPIPHSDCAANSSSNRNHR